MTYDVLTHSLMYKPCGHALDRMFEHTEDSSALTVCNVAHIDPTYTTHVQSLVELGSVKPNSLLDGCTSTQFGKHFKIVEPHPATLEKKVPVPSHRGDVCQFVFLLTIRSFSFVQGISNFIGNIKCGLGGASVKLGQQNKTVWGGFLQ